jgi:hypothetical protein
MPFDLDKIGQVLKTARIEKGLALEDVSAELFIRKSIIGAIESADWESLPHDVYVKGYVSQYAAFLNVRDLVRLELRPGETPSDTAQTPRKERRDAPSKQERMPLGGHGSKKKIFGAVVMTGVLVAFLVFVNVQKPVGTARPAYQPVQGAQETAAALPVPRPDQKPPDGTADNNYETVAGADTSAKGYDPQEEKVVLETKKLMIACQERTWVRVVIDGSEKKEFMLNQEEVVVLNAKESFDLLIGNAAGVKLFYNGKDIGFTGASGEVKRVNLS